MKTGMSVRSNLSMKSILLALCCVLTLVMSGLNVSAAGTTSLALSSSTPKQGETVTLTVTASSSADITVKYTNAVLQLKSCSVDYTADGNAISFTAKSATIVYDTIASGKANIIVSSSALTGSSAVVNVAAGDGTTTNADTTETDDEQTDDALNTVAEGDASPFVLTCANDTITISTPETLFSENLVAATLNAGDSSYDAYQYGTLESEFYYLYGTNASGVTGWFQYDANTGVLQRANQENLTYLEGQIDSAAASTSSSTVLGFPAVNVVCVLIVIIVVLIMVLINILIRRREDDDYVFGDDDSDEEDEDDEDDEDEEEEDEEDDYSRNRRRRVSQDTIVISSEKKNSDSVRVRHYAPKDEELKNDEPKKKRYTVDTYDDDSDDFNDEEAENDGDLNDFWGEKAAKKKERRKIFSRRKAVDDYEDEDDYSDEVNGDFDVIDLNDL